MYIELAGISCEIFIEDSLLEKKLVSFFSSYIAGSANEFKIIIEGLCKDLQPRQDRGYPVVIEPGEDGGSIIKNENNNKVFLARISKDLKICSFNIKNNFCYSDIISTIRAYLHFLIEKRGGFWLHASCGTIDGKSYVFTGKHNAGKSTALNNLVPDKKIAEDCLVVKADGKKPRVFSTPFRMERMSGGIANAVIFPRKTKKVSCFIKENLSGSVTEVVSNTMFSSPENIDVINTVIDNIFRFCSLVPGFTLYFTKTANLRKVIL